MYVVVCMRRRRRRRVFPISFRLSGLWRKRERGEQVNRYVGRTSEELGNWL